MQDKTTLINSMNNLINHISISRKNQQQMFSSLTKKDFDKIISNLDDTLLKLRITTVKLLAELLYNNPTLKIKFCELMDIRFSQNSNIVLNGNFNKILDKFQKKEQELFLLLKHHEKTIKQQVQQRKGTKQPLLWFINPKNYKLSVQYIQRQQFTLITNFTSNKSIQFDPIDCIFGITISSLQTQYNQNMKTSGHFSSLTDSHPRTDITKQTDHSQKSITHRQVNYNPVHVPMSTKNSVFLKQSNPKVGNYSFTHNNSYTSSEIRRNKNGYEEPYVYSPQHPEYLNMSMNLQIQPHTSTSKKQNQQIHSSLSQKDKYGNRLSLQINDFRGGYRKVNTFQNQTLGNSEGLKIDNTLPSDHHHGIKLMTPRQSLKNGQKLIIVNSGANTERAYTERQPPTVEREKIGDPNQRIKTIHLGGMRGSETMRQKKNIKIQRH